jgi:hypothetical protein
MTRTRRIRRRTPTTWPSAPGAFAWSCAAERMSTTSPTVPRGAASSAARRPRLRERSLGRLPLSELLVAWPAARLRLAEGGAALWDGAFASEVHRWSGSRWRGSASGASPAWLLPLLALVRGRGPPSSSPPCGSRPGRAWWRSSFSWRC